MWILGLKGLGNLYVDIGPQMIPSVITLTSKSIL